jgi:hypothetical protein
MSTNQSQQPGCHTATTNSDNSSTTSPSTTTAVAAAAGTTSTRDENANSTSKTSTKAAVGASKHRGALLNLLRILTQHDETAIKKLNAIGQLQALISRRASRSKAQAAAEDEQLFRAHQSQLLQVLDVMATDRDARIRDKMPALGVHVALLFHTDLSVVLEWVFGRLLKPLNSTQAIGYITLLSEVCQQLDWSWSRILLQLFLTTSTHACTKAFTSTGSNNIARTCHRDTAAFVAAARFIAAHFTRSIDSVVSRGSLDDRALRIGIAAAVLGIHRQPDCLAFGYQNLTTSGSRD